jgi:hypothetical protein
VLLSADGDPGQLRHRPLDQTPDEGPADPAERRPRKPLIKKLRPGT